MTPKELYESIVKVLDDKKAEEIAVLDTTDLTVVSEYFVIATGNSSTHVKSLADDVEYELQQLGIEPEHIEGRATGWILLDYGSVLLHVFTRDNRDYYNLEHLWADAKQVDISGLVTE
ncbi:MAG: ribosome silencing factor [Clostridia bacterium]|nr:ribosome silencing factor [Clostridia bacterium]MBQ6931434.1 ribosome silencing factor [Clostridia bacterium]